MKKALIIFCFAISFCGLALAQETEETKKGIFEFAIGGGTSVSKLENVETGLAVHSAQNIKLFGHFTFCVEENVTNSAYLYGGNYSSTLINAGIRYKGEDGDMYGALRITGGLMYNKIPEFTLIGHDYTYYLTQYSSKGTGTNALFGLEGGVALNHRHTMALNVDLCAGYAMIKNELSTRWRVNDDSPDTWNKESKLNNYLFVNGTINFVMIF